MPLSSDGRLRVTYTLRCAGGEDPWAKAQEIALEQTVELPPAAVPAELLVRVAGRVEAVTPLDGARWSAVLSYDPIVVGDDLPQLLNLLFGNISLKSGITLAEVAWPAALLARHYGPRAGIAGLRALTGVHDRPLLATALKPLGRSPAELAALAHGFALGGIDLIKDDHGLVDQEPARFADRVAACQQAVERAAEATGRAVLYLPNLTGGLAGLAERIARVRAAGCRAVLLSPLLVGLDALGRVADAGLAVMAHPALAGAFFQPDHGLAPAVLLGELFRLAGADAVIYPNPGGRFDLPPEACAAINAALRAPLGQVRPAFPVPAGGIDVERVSYWLERYGVDTIFLVGGSLYLRPDPVAAARRMLDAVQGPGR